MSRQYRKRHDDSKGSSRVLSQLRSEKYSLEYMIHLENLIKKTSVYNIIWNHNIYKNYCYELGDTGIFLLNNYPHLLKRIEDKLELEGYIMSLTGSR